MDHEELGKICRHLPVLEAVEDYDEPPRQRDVREELGQSKATTHRKVSWLEENGLLQTQDRGYRLTDYGEYVLGELSKCGDRLERASELSEFLELVDAGLPVDDLGDTRVTRATEENPFLPEIRLAEVVEGTEDCRVATNAVAPRAFAVGRNRVRDGEMELRIVLDSSTVESMEIPEWYGEGFRDDLDSGNLRLWIHPDVPYRIGVIDDVFVAGSDDENGVPEAFLESESSDAVEWANRRFREFKDEAEEVAADDL